MSKDRRKLLHIHSSVNDKQPTPATLEIGELGVNNAKGNAFISTKNSDGEVVRFSEDETVIGWMEQKEVFPYEGYVRGSDDNLVGEVTEQDLIENKSNIIIKLNQVAPENTDYTPYDEKVNGAKDIYGNEINPIAPYGYKDGAGLAIDMSQYAMQGANPSFSSITTTCNATLNGTTKILGDSGRCGSEFTVDVENACVDASDTLNEFGLLHSNFGTSCDGSQVSQDTTLKGNKISIDSLQGDKTIDMHACTHINGFTNDFQITECNNGQGNAKIKACSGITLSSKNITLTDADCGDGQATVEVNDLCLVGERKVNVYGDATNIGIDCNNHTIASETNVKGDDIQVFATDQLCESGKTVSIFASEGGKLVIGGSNCNGDISDVSEDTYPITYVRRPGIGICDIHATTVDDALDEVYDRSRISLTSTAHTDTSSASNYSYTEYTLHQDTRACDANINFTVNNTIVSMSADPYPASSEMSKKYTLWQYVGDERIEIGEIDIPKDHILKDATIEHGILDGDVWTDCSATTTPQNCHWYIKFVWNVYYPETGHPDDKILYLLADDFVQDLVVDNPTNNGVCLNIWYDGTTKKISAHTEVHMIHGNDNDRVDTQYTISDNCKHSLTSYTLNSTSGDVKGNPSLTNWTYDPFGNKVDIKVPTDVKHIYRNTLNVIYGSVCDKADNSETYDPGDGTENTTRNSTITIPKTISDITNGTISLNDGCGGSCITVNGDICMTGNTIAAQGFYSKSDANLKENIQSVSSLDYDKVNKFEFKSFNFKDDETKTKTYGVIAQEVQDAGLNEIVHTDESGTLNVDYISLLILKIVSLENKVNELSRELKALKSDKADEAKSKK